MANYVKSTLVNMGTPDTFTISEVSSKSFETHLNSLLQSHPTIREKLSYDQIVFGWNSEKYEMLRYYVSKEGKYI